MTFAALRTAIAPGLAVLLLVQVGASAAPLKIVAVGASNTSGWGVAAASAYPAQLQAMLKARGYAAEVINAGMAFDTTRGMLARIDSAVPQDARLVILQPGANDLRFLGTREQRAANIAAMERRLWARHIQVIVFDPEIPHQFYQWDGIHLTAQGHAWIATSLLPQVLKLVGPPTR